MQIAICDDEKSIGLILEEKINHQEELERIESTKNKVRKRKRHFIWLSLMW